jgi:hypothetical protein
MGSRFFGALRPFPSAVSFFPRACSSRRFSGSEIGGDAKLYSLEFASSGNSEGL